jgi:hypothetical protein
MKTLEKVWAGLVWFRYESPVRNFGSDRLDDLRWGMTNGIAKLRGDPAATLKGGSLSSLSGCLNVRCWILAKVVDFLDWVTPPPEL